MLYRLYIDECGTDDVVNCHLPQHRYLALTGVMMSLAHVREVVAPAIDALKRAHFPQHDPDGSPLVLHRSDFLAAKGSFQPLANPERMEDFVADLTNMLAHIDHTVITVVIDKEAMLRRSHWKNKEPYHYCSEVLIEKYMLCLERKGARGDVFAESRKSRKNKALQEAFTEVYSKGTRYLRSDKISERLTTSTIKFREKHHNTPGLQIADAYAKPSMDRVMYQRDKTWQRKPFSVRLGKLLYEEKYNRSPHGEPWGWGMKYL
jgi:hypothetical protein